MVDNASVDVSNDPVIEELEEDKLVEPYHNPRVRPIEIVFTAIFGFILSALIMPFAYLVSVGDIGAVKPFDLSVMFVFFAAGSVFSHALFQMQRWSIIGYAILVIVTQLLLLLAGNWTFILLIIPLLFLVPAATQWSKLE